MVRRGQWSKFKLKNLFVWYLARVSPARISKMYALHNAERQTECSALFICNTFGGHIYEVFKTGKKKLKLMADSVCAMGEVIKKRNVAIDSTATRNSIICNKKIDYFWPTECRFSFLNQNRWESEIVLYLLVKLFSRTNYVTIVNCVIRRKWLVCVSWEIVRIR